MNNEAFEAWWLTTGKHVGKNAARMAWDEAIWRFCVLGMSGKVENSEISPPDVTRKPESLPVVKPEVNDGSNQTD